MSALDAASARAPRHTVGVVVVARPLPPGHLLVRRDVTLARFPSSLVPVDALRHANEAIGRRLAGPLSPRQVLTPGLLVGSGLTAGLPPGLVALAVDVDGGSAGLVRRGQYVDLLARPSPDLGAVPGAAAETRRSSGLATHVLVLATLPDRTDSTAARTVRLVLALTRPVAVTVAAREGLEAFTAVVYGP